MARKERMITRTFDVTECDVMMIELQANIYTIPEKLAGKLNADEALAKVREMRETADFKVVAVSNVKHVEELRGMPESVFMAYSEVLPPRTKASEECEE